MRAGQSGNQAVPAEEELAIKPGTTLYAVIKTSAFRRLAQGGFKAGKRRERKGLSSRGKGLLVVTEQILKGTD